VEIWSARWFRDGKRLVALGREPSGTGVHLYLLDGGSAPARRVSEVPVMERAVALSPDERRAAVVGSEGRVLVVSLEDGLARDVPGASGIPRRWASDHELWLSRSGHNMPAENTVLRVDVRTGKTIEQRTYRPSEPAGSTSRSDLEIAPDGQGVAYTEGRIVGSLYLVRGLVPPRR
jgi:hypothetical protein